MNKGLIEHFENLTDPRVERTKRYPLIEIILLIIAGTVSGCDGWKSLKDFGEAKLDWLRKFLPYKYGIPVDDTFAPNAEKTLTAVGQHWGIENQLHWTLDMTFREDESRIRAEAASENFAIMRHIALNLIKNDTSRKASMKRKLFMAALEDDFRETIIRQVI